MSSLKSKTKQICEQNSTYTHTHHLMWLVTQVESSCSCPHGKEKTQQRSAMSCVVVNKVALGSKRAGIQMGGKVLLCQEYFSLLVLLLLQPVCFLSLLLLHVWRVQLFQPEATECLSRWCGARGSYQIPVCEMEIFCQDEANPYTHHFTAGPCFLWLQPRFAAASFLISLGDVKTKNGSADRINVCCKGLQKDVIITFQGFKVLLMTSQKNSRSNLFYFRETALSLSLR